LEEKKDAKSLILILKGREFTHREIAIRCFTTEQAIYRWLNGDEPIPVFLDALQRLELETRPAISEAK
jgi:hypothetical protein